jgi:uncharacterized protein (DUF488 family)
VSGFSRTILATPPSRAQGILCECLALMKSRRIEKVMRPERLDRACLLCAEAKPEHCHRRLVAEYLKEKLRDLEIEHLL